MMMLRLRTALLGFLICVTLVMFGNTAYIHLKAVLAQQLIAYAWQQGDSTKPWPWADTWPVARLRFNKSDIYVLNGADGSSLAFGAGLVNGTHMPGSGGTALIGGHRDTHFRLLRDLSIGERFLVQTTDGRWLTFEVSVIEVINSNQQPEMVIHSDRSEILLVTCYPFDAVVPGGPLRYVVRAEQL